ncbi:MAG: CinA family nicotinamide mononucleotide deamidase-related protein, partial [Staphylococcus aureus]|nr:CinA family nicotinamide mononucleotide deamidase-related protein [Staphylococcus aureus]
AVGSELLLGQIANTNGQYLSKLFNSIGKSVVEHTVIGDNPQRLEYVIKQCLSRFDTIVLTGGLGPTKDDLTKHTVAKVLGKNLVTDEASLNFIKNYFKEQGQDMTSNNKQQALVIEDAIVLPNKHGMAPGMLVELGKQKIILLPGPPKEMQPMVKNELLSHFINHNRIIHSELLRFAGIGESKVETILIDLIDKQTNPTIAPLAGSHEVYIRLTANADSKEQAQSLIQPVKQEILDRIGEYYYGSDDTLIEQAVIKKIHEPFVIYDGITNGALYHRLKEVDLNDVLKGMINHNENFVDINKPIEQQLKDAVQFVNKLFNVSSAIILLEYDGVVHIGYDNNFEFKTEQFKMSKSRNLLKNRSQNYALIRLLNWLRTTN